MRFSWMVVATLCASTWGIIIPDTLAAGRGFFEAAPRLDKVRTTFDEAQVRGATYYFTVTLPEDAGESLSQLIIEQKGGVSDIPLLLDKTTAFVGTSQNQQKRLRLSNVSQSDDNRKIIAAFEDPVAPGTTVTLGLKPRKNPQNDGVYLFGVTASPTGNSDHDLYLGVGRLHFYDRHDNNDVHRFHN